ncbi:MAG: class SAM-dependent methyltransferase [Labilithrix sp.]|nr:class SAM-dependent methyltransferase [Labilithrix sp.]
MGADLVEQYQRQERWRRWDEALSVLPLERGHRVLDLGCGVGQVAARLNDLGADVVGLDSSDELLAAARARHPHLRFEKADIRAVDPERFGLVDGLWASFVTAYFPDLRSILTRWSNCLRPGGWLAMVEMDDLLGHDPLPPRFRPNLESFYEEARRSGGYDFECGRALADAARAAGLSVLHEGVLADDELSFVGAARTDVLEAWRSRLSRMGGLKAFMGEQFDDFERAFLEALGAESHRSNTRVVFVIARRG